MFVIFTNLVGIRKDFILQNKESIIRIMIFFLMISVNLIIFLYYAIRGYE